MVGDLVVVRPLGLNDLPSVSLVHERAFPNSALGQLGTEAVRRYYTWLLEGPHRSTCLGAFDASALVGFLFGGTFNGAMSGFLRANRGYLARHVLTHPWLVASPLVRDRIKLALRLLRPRKPSPSPLPVAPAFGVLAIAVDPRAQGRGVGRSLMTCAEALAKTEGFGEMELTVAAWNHQAIQFYLLNGWHQVGVPWNGAMRKALQ